MLLKHIYFEILLFFLVTRLSKIFLVNFYKRKINFEEFFFFVFQNGIIFSEEKNLVDFDG